MRSPELLQSHLAVSPSLLRKLAARQRAPAVEQQAQPDTPTVDMPPASTARNPSEPDRTATTQHRRVDAAKPPRPTHYWTWRLLADRFTFEECSEIRGIDEATILSHLSRAADEGFAIAAEWFLSDEQVAAIGPLVEANPPEQLRGVVEQLPPDLRYEHVALFLKCRANSSP